MDSIRALRYRPAVLLSLGVASLALVLPAQTAVSRTAPSAKPTIAMDIPLSPRLAEIFAGGEPASLADFAAMETYLKAYLEKVLPAVVRISGATGVSVPGGYILTAGHVTRSAGRKITVRTATGRSVQTKSLGMSNRTDAGLIKVLGDAKIPSLAMGESGTLKPGAWCVMLGYPGGTKPGLTPPLRLGRVLRVGRPGGTYLVSDCTMSAGDSGGPLLDMQGRVIGINSRISRNLQQNMHTPIDAFARDWKELVDGEVLGRSRNANRSRRRARPAKPGWIGVTTVPGSKPLVVQSVAKGSPAATAGVRPGDVIVRLGNRKMFSSRTLKRQLQRLHKDDEVKVLVTRDGKEREYRVRVGSAPVIKKPKKAPVREAQR